jgi:hypothetical protein
LGFSDVSAVGWCSRSGAGLALLVGLNLSPERAQRELRHLLRLRSKDNVRTRINGLQRGVLGFAVAFIAAGKVIAAKSLVAKLLFAAVIGSVVAFPIAALVAFGVLGIVIGVIALATDGICLSLWPDIPVSNDCDTRNQRRRKLDAMITERETLLSGTPRTTI